MIVDQAANTINGNINSGYMSICVTVVLLYICIQNMLRHVMLETITVEKDISNHDALTRNEMLKSCTLAEKNPLQQALRFMIQQPTNVSTTS